MGPIWRLSADGSEGRPRARKMPVVASVFDVSSILTSLQFCVLESRFINQNNIPVGTLKYTVVVR